ncbi:MAG: hypothetical protein ACLFTR_03200 [Candidatus Woesearchaeota archaeon]
MKLKVRSLKISAQGHLVCMLNSEEAFQLQIRDADRVTLRKGKKQVTAVVDVTNTHHFLRKGQIGLMEELARELSVKRGEVIDVELAEEPYSIDYIRKKLKGKTLDDVEMHSIISDVSKGQISQEELSVFITACSVHGLRISEILDMVNSLVGEAKPIPLNQHPVVDIRVIGDPSGILKHGVNAVVSAAGISTVAALESPGSNPSSSSDLFNAFSPYPVNNSSINTSISRINCAYVNQEDKYISTALRRIKHSEAPLSLYPRDLLVASLLSQASILKSSHVYVNVLYGGGTPLPDEHSAKSMVRVLDRVSRKLKIRLDSGIYHIDEVFTGNSGPSIEAKILMDTLSDSPMSLTLRSKIIEMAGNIIDMVKGSRGYRTAKETVDSDSALEHLVKILRYHGAKASRKRFTFKGAFTYNIKAEKDSNIMSYNNQNIMRIAKICGAPHDLVAGVHMHKNVHSVVSKNDVIASLHSKNKQRLLRAQEHMKRFPLFELS